MNWSDCMAALDLIVESPDAEKGYEDLKKYFNLNNMNEESEAIDFMIKERFRDHGSNINQE